VVDLINFKRTNVVKKIIFVCESRMNTVIIRVRQIYLLLSFFILLCARIMQKTMQSANEHNIRRSDGAMENSNNDNNCCAVLAVYIA